VIFTTAYDAYAIKAFEVNALDYLMKPIAPATAGRGAGHKSARVPRRCAWNVYLCATATAAGLSRCRIFFCSKPKAITRGVYFSGQRPLIRRSLNALEEQLDPAMFFRANRKEILNLKWIDKVDLGVAGGLSVTLRGGRQVEMSRRQSGRLREILSL
jgi:two-component system LytT family response regulator